MNPGPGYRLLSHGEQIPKGAQWFSESRKTWRKTEDVGAIFRPSSQVRFYRVPIASKASKVRFDLGEKLSQRASERAKSLHMSPTAYVRQCVESELARCNMAKIQAQAPTATPPIAHWQNGESD